VSLQVDAAKVLVDGDRDGLAKRLGLVSDSLNSCRAELRNCLWDLRNQALDEPDMEAAIRQALAPLVGDVNLSVRFKARRSHVSDNTAHAVLRIVRELVSNAIRHGMAKNVRIAGGLEDGSIRFSVWDDGCGFNPDSVPGVRQGHFGLTGIRERVRKLNGTIQIESAPGRGAKFTVSLEGAKAEKS
jgi:signal transduction histidine kinase